MPLPRRQSKTSSERERPAKQQSRTCTPRHGRLLDEAAEDDLDDTYQKVD
jgi:hypothetical protein